MASETFMERAARRASLYGGALLTIGTLASATIAISAGFVTREVRSTIAKTQEELAATREYFRQRAVADSVRFERIMEVVELAVVAVVEPSGTQDQRSAVAELRRRRHVTPRP